MNDFLTMTKRILITGLLFLVTNIYSQQADNQPKAVWNGYTQLRFSGNFAGNYNFSVRRLKFWVRSGSGFSKHWSFKIQTVFASKSNEKLFLEDVKAGYKTGRFSFEFGQLTPQFSLQRFQSDAKIPVMERSIPLNALIPNGVLGVRDVGFQAGYSGKNKRFKTWIGIFNGFGVLEYHFNYSGYMFTHKTQYKFVDKSGFDLLAGYSLSYRKAQNLQFRHVLEDTVLFSGIDSRLNLFIRARSKYVNFQAEYFLADFSGQQANGYYLLTEFKYKKNRLGISFEQYNDLIESTDDTPYLRLTHSYLFKGNKLKLSNGVFFRPGYQLAENFSYQMQLQIFFN